MKTVTCQLVHKLGRPLFLHGVNLTELADKADVQPMGRLYVAKVSSHSETNFKYFAAWIGE